ncbi:neuropeptide-like 4 [Tribolium madens]|uniref:neuropeptide-like 4 n=1 Tax=Tribolium madens TaxID=41895 RepID=UPI001CF7205A|nr:neuropeptide-like 4 [Tribolium madens]
MFKLICFFALLVAVFAVPNPAPAPAPGPKPDPIYALSYTAGTPLTYSYSRPITYDYGYGLSPYASGYYGSYSYGLPLAYRNLYI